MGYWLYRCVVCVCGLNAIVAAFPLYSVWFAYYRPKVSLEMRICHLMKFCGFICAVRWAVPTQRWIWTKRVCCQTVSAESDLSLSVDLIPAADALTPTQTLRRWPPQRQISLKELKTPRTGSLHSYNTDSMKTLPWVLLSVCYMQLYLVVCAWERLSVLLGNRWPWNLSVQDATVR